LATAAPLYNASEVERLFRETGLDAIIARSGQNVAYLSGLRFPGTLGRLQDFAHNPRGAVVTQFPGGAATLIVSKIAAGIARRWSWLDDVREFTEYSEDPFVLAAATLKERGVANGRIGIERRMLGVTQWETLSDELPRAEFVDCSDLLERVRNIKTPAEIAILRNAAHVQDEAYLDVFRTARPGDTERELHARVLHALVLRGAESAHGILQGSKNPITYGGEGDVRVNRGDVVRTDYVSYSQGYAANLSRMAVMGHPSSSQEEIYARLLSIHRETIARMLKPGVKSCDVYGFVRERCVAEGFPAVASLVGHSIGVWWHQEAPMLIPSEPQKLEPGMVVCLEPILDGYWHLQDELLITEDGCELLSDLFNTDTLFAMGA